MFVLCCFIVVAFNIFSLYLIFVFFINMCLGMFLLGFVLCGTLCFLDLGDYFLSHVRDIFSYYLFKYFLRPFFSLSLFLRPLWCKCSIWCCPRGLLTFIVSFYSLFCSMSAVITILFSSSVICFSASFILLLIPSSVFFISVIVFFNSHWSLFF